jgi:putative flippase GtrA
MGSRSSAQPAESWRDELATFAKSLVVSAIVFVVELVCVLALDARHLAPAASFAIVQLAGTSLGFALNKYWAFGAAHSKRGLFEGARSLAVFAGSFVLNIALPSVGTYVFGLAAPIAFTAAQIVVGLAWNFPLNRLWVFSTGA